MAFYGKHDAKQLASSETIFQLLAQYSDDLDGYNESLRKRCVFYVHTYTYTCVCAHRQTDFHACMRVHTHTNV